MTARLKPAEEKKEYYALTPDSICGYLAGYKSVASRLGGSVSQWQAKEVGDGNLNLVFIVEGPKGAVVVKQALPYVRLVGESWPLPLSRAHYEHLALVEQSKHASEYVPEIYEYDEAMALTVMEYLSPHIILRKGLIKAVRYPHMADHLGKFLARTLFFTSDLHLPAPEKKRRISYFLDNTAMCKITEDLVFDEPYFDAPMNRHTSPQLDDIAQAFKKDARLKSAVQDMKWRFLNNAEALIHGDLHTGSVMVTEEDTRVIDPEFAFYGPIGFDVGAIIANLFMAYFSQSGHEKSQGERAQYSDWLLDQIQVLWAVFEHEIFSLVMKRNEKNPGGDVYSPRLFKDAPSLAEITAKDRIQKIWADSLGFAGCKIIRRILGLAHVEDFESIENPDTRSSCEKRALAFARRLLLDREQFSSMNDVVEAAHEN